MLGYFIMNNVLASSLSGLLKT